MENKLVFLFVVCHCDVLNGRMGKFVSNVVTNLIFLFAETIFFCVWLWLCWTVSLLSEWLAGQLQDANCIYNFF